MLNTASLYVDSINFHILNKESPSEINLAEMPRRFFFRHLFVLVLSSSLLVAFSSAQQPEHRSRNQKASSSIEDDLGLERRPFDDSLKHSSFPGEKKTGTINEDLLDYHDTYRDHSHDHEHVEEGEKVVHWEL